MIGKQELVPTVHVVEHDERVSKEITDAVQDRLDFSAVAHLTIEHLLADPVKEHPGVVVLDLRNFGLEALEIINKLREQGAEWPVVVITEAGGVQMAVDAMKNGAVDFLEKPFEIKVLTDRVKKAAVIAMDRFAVARRRKRAEDLLNKLSPVERDVITRVAAGHTNRQIASDMKSSLRTVEDRRARAMRKISASNLAEIISWDRDLRGISQEPDPHPRYGR